MTIQLSKGFPAKPGWYFFQPKRQAGWDLVYVRIMPRTHAFEVQSADGSLVDGTGGFWSEEIEVKLPTAKGDKTR